MEVSISEAASLIVASNPSGLFATEIMEELKAGGWTDNEIRECLNSMVKNGTFTRTIEVRPRIVTRYRLNA